MNDVNLDVAILQRDSRIHRARFVDKVELQTIKKTDNGRDGVLPADNVNITRLEAGKVG